MGEQLDMMHEATSLANTSLLQMPVDIRSADGKRKRRGFERFQVRCYYDGGLYDEQHSALCADESEHALTQWGGEGGDWDHTPGTDREAIVKLRQRVSKRTMMQKILGYKQRFTVDRASPIQIFYRRPGGGFGAPYSTTPSPRRAVPSSRKVAGRSGPPYLPVNPKQNGAPSAINECDRAATPCTLVGPHVVG